MTLILIRFLLLCLFCAGHCEGFSAEATPLISLVELCRDAEACVLSQEGIASLHSKYSKWNNQTVTIRGFLYQSEDGRWILASSPNLKTCCVGHAAKVVTQVSVHGNSLESSPDRVIALNGTFVIEPTFDNQKALTGLFQLRNVTVTPQNSLHSLPWLLLIGLLGAVSVFIFTIRRFRR